jgi:hypothetical protein
MVLSSIPPLTEMTTRNLPRGKWRPARKAVGGVSTENMEALTSHNTMGLHGMLQRLHSFTFYSFLFETESTPGP